MSRLVIFIADNALFIGIAMLAQLCSLSFWEAVLVLGVLVVLVAAHDIAQEYK